ncbi:Dodecin [Streptomyces lydicus]|nr:Dodecin [Streptomyces lydicus]
MTDIVGTSQQSVDAAINNGIRRASQSLRNLDWFEISEVRGHIVDGHIDHYQVGLKVGFRLEDAE